MHPKFHVPVKCTSLPCEEDWEKGQCAGITGLMLNFCFPRFNIIRNETGEALIVGKFVRIWGGVPHSFTFIRQGELVFLRSQNHLLITCHTKRGYAKKCQVVIHGPVNDL